jgi:hypothetical protein
MAWNILRFTGMIGGDAMKLTCGQVDLKAESFKFKTRAGVIEMPFHQGLVKYFEQYFAERQITSGLLFTQNRLGFSHQMRHAIKMLKHSRVYGSSTPRDSLRHYLSKSARWPKEWIELFLKRPKQPLSQKIVGQLRKMINALSIDG